MRSPIEVSVRATDYDGNPIKVEAKSSHRVFALPDLNPNDSFKLRVISSTPVPDQYESKIENPKVTYSGGVASNREYISVSGRYSEIIDFLDDLPTIFQIVVIVAGSFFITILWLIPIALASDANDRRKQNALTEERADETDT